MNKLLLALILFMTVACGEEKKHAGNNVPNTSIEILDAEALDLIDTTAAVEKIAEGFEWSEGPLYIKDGDYLLFSDVPKNKIFKWKEGEGTSLYLDSSGYVGNNPPKREPGSNGLLLDKNGKLVLCQHGLRRVARMEATLDSPRAIYTALADKFEGRKLNSPNDAVFHSNGDLYFTDPPYGHEKIGDDPALEQKQHGIYRAKPDGTVDLLNGDIKYPNGIALTPDERYLIVGYSNSENMIWMKYELDSSGLAKAKSEFYKLSEEDRKLPGAPDGLKINTSGYVFASGPGGIWVFNSSAKPIARIYTGQATSNCTLSPDERTLFMTCDNYVYRVKLK